MAEETMDSPVGLTVMDGVSVKTTFKKGKKVCKSIKER
jgi:hypothetical protein